MRAFFDEMWPRGQHNVTIHALRFLAERCNRQAQAGNRTDHAWAVTRSSWRCCSWWPFYGQQTDNRVFLMVPFVATCGPDDTTVSWPVDTDYVDDSIGDTRGVVRLAQQTCGVFPNFRIRHVQSWF